MRLAKLAALLPLIALAGCQPEGTTGKTVLRVSNWGGAGDDSEYEKLVQEFYKEFERENPDVDLRIEGIPGEYVPKMMLNFVAGTEPDVMTVDASSAAIFVNNGVLADLTPIAQNDPEFKITDYFPNVVDVGRRDGKVYMIPGDFTPMVVYYNKRLFDAAGVLRRLPPHRPGHDAERPVRLRLQQLDAWLGHVALEQRRRGPLPRR